MGSLPSWSQRVPLLVWIAVVIAALVAAATRLTVEKPRGLWSIRPRPPASRLWDFAREQFGEREVLIVATRLPSGSALGADTVTAALEAWMRNQPEVGGVFGVQSVRRLRRGVGFITSRARRAQWRELRQAVLSPDSLVVITYVTLNVPPGAGSEEVLTAFFSRLADRWPALLPRGTDLLLAGQPALDIAVIRLLRVELRTAVPLALVFIVLALLVTIGVRSIAPAVTALASVVVQIGGMAAVGIPVSSATTVAFPLTLVVGLSYGVHMCLAIDRARDVVTARREIGAPLTWSYVTTAVALASLALSPIFALRLFALVSTAGVTIAFLAAVTLLPRIQSRARSAWSTRGRALLTVSSLRLFGSAARHRTATAAVWVVVAATAIFGVSRVTIEPNSHLALFDRDHPLVLAHLSLDDALGGSVPLELLVEADSGIAARQPRVRERILEFGRVAGELLALGPVFAPLDQRTLAHDSLLLASARNWFEGREPRYTRAVFSMPAVPTADARRMIQTLDSLAAVNSDSTVRMQVTGSLPSAMPMLRALVDSQVRSLVVLFAVVVVFLVVAARSWRLGFVLLIPNALALAAATAAMGYLGISIDFVTVTVSSLVLGVAVDDTLQITWAMRRGAAVRQTHVAPLALRRTAGPVSLASIVMIAGCLALLFSPFPPTRHLGGLFAIGLAVALAADLTLTPSLLSLLYATGRRRGPGSAVHE